MHYSLRVTASGIIFMSHHSALITSSFHHKTKHSHGTHRLIIPNVAYHYYLHCTHFQYLKNQWLRYRNPFHDFIMFFKSCCSRGEIVNRERSISQQNTHVPPIVTDGVLSRANDKEFRRFLVLKYIIQKIGA